MEVIEERCGGTGNDAWHIEILEAHHEHASHLQGTRGGKHRRSGAAEVQLACR
jgi:hypothetical protein